MEKASTSVATVNRIVTGPHLPSQKMTSVSLCRSSSDGEFDCDIVGLAAERGDLGGNTLRGLGIEIGNDNRAAPS